MSAIELAIEELLDNTTELQKYYSKLKLNKSTEKYLDYILENSFVGECSSV